MDRNPKKLEGKRKGTTFTQSSKHAAPPDNVLEKFQHLRSRDPSLDQTTRVKT